ncbi:type IV toxin-antitoxin system AbiEi family antitoxin domain-containing protein [Ammonicoccus fulvus]|uniref:Type IV toxin-antitoxin system AbiEi family antitoxin domain-containing protein n=1 Tax=Ammonicoccus fulvus TaxID=3138240 RepID=A0ABZ3FW95_9ACTN
MVARIVSTAQLLAEGLTPALIRAMVSAGHLRRVRRGFYERGEYAALTPEVRHRVLMEAVLSRHPGCVFSHISAAVAHGLPIPEKALGRAHVVRAADNSGSKRMQDLCLHRSTFPILTTMVEGLAVTPLDRTVLDLVRVLHGADALAVADRALAVGLDRNETLALLEADGSRRGNVQARRVLLLADARAESPGESWTRWSMAEAGTPMPDLQAEFHDPRTGEFLARTDFYWREHNLVGEFDGKVKYGRLLKPGQDVGEVVLAEKQREERLRRVGLWMVRFDAGEANKPWVVDRIVRDGIALARSRAA